MDKFKKGLDFLVKLCYNVKAVCGRIDPKQNGDVSKWS